MTRIPFLLLALLLFAACSDNANLETEEDVTTTADTHSSDTASTDATETADADAEDLNTGTGMCRDSNDCSGSEECLGPNAPQVCGIPPRQGCASDADCFDGRCHAIFDTCSSDGIGSECRAACATDAECGTDMRCAEGACVPTTCDEGYVCPAHQQCDTSRFTPSTPVYERNHGCFDVPCSGDADCGGTLSCVNGVCQTDLGSCVVPTAVP